MFARRKKRGLTESIHRSVWPRTGWRRALTYFWKRVVRLTASPHAVAAGAAAGAFASFTPLVGFHFLLSFALAFVVRGNMLAAGLGTAVGNPLTFPFIWGATYEVGRWILSGGHHEISAASVDDPSHEAIGRGILEVGLDRLWPIMKPMLVGAVPLGTISAVITYSAVFFSVRSLQARRRHRREEAALRAFAARADSSAGPDDEIEAEASLPSARSGVAEERERT